MEKIDVIVIGGGAAGMMAAGRAWEVIDVDAKTGGYNLQAAFSTGYIAGENAAMSLLN